jgi:hypothetical protein
MLIFPLKKQWYEKIKSGEKTIEYRRTTDYWKSRIVNAYCNSVSSDDELANWINNNSDNAYYAWDGFVESACEGINCCIPCILRLGYTKTKMVAKIKRIDAVSSEKTDLHIEGKLVFALHLSDVKEIE